MRPKRRKRHQNPGMRRTLVPRTSKPDMSISNNGMRYRHLIYISRLLDEYHLTNDLLEAGLFYIDHQTMHDLLKSFYDLTAVDSDGDRTDQYYDCLDRIHDIDDLARYLYEDLVQEKLTLKENAFINKIQEILKKDIRALSASCRDELLLRISELSSVFRFTSEEESVLAALYSIFEVQTDILEDILDDLEYNDFLRFMSVITEIDYKEIKTILSKNGSLYKSGIISDITHSSRNFVEFETRIAQYLSGIGEISLTERFIKKDRKKVLPVKYFELPDETFETIDRLLTDEKPCNILLAGIAGTGKTEFARSAARATGKPVFTLNVGGSERNRTMSLKHDEENAVYVSFRAAEELVKTSGGILIADEMDVMLNHAEKGWLNLFLDSSTAKIIWISNDLRWVEESTMRRFHYVSYFDKLSSKERIKIWENVLSSSPLKRHIKKPDIKRLAKEHTVNAGGIAHALSTLERLADVKDYSREDILSRLDHLLESHRQQINKEFNSRKTSLNSIDRSYDLSVLNTTEDTGEIISSVKEFGKGLLTGTVKEGNINLLFSGLPGTGKTEFVKHISNVCGLELLVKRYSDLVSPYVGETEKNIARAFKEAEAEKAILFIDEADSLFTSRETATRSWETSRTNELLAWMENFMGILICATNHTPEVDTAAMRRFHWKVNFKPMKSEQRLSLYKSFFDFAEKPLSKTLAVRIKNIEGLTPGDMKTVRERVKFKKDISHADIVSALEAEQAYKKGEAVEKIGFQE